MMVDWFWQSIVADGKLRLFSFFVFFIGAFLFIRFSVRMIRAQVKWWPGNVTPGGQHIHHVVFGLVFMCIGGVGGLAVQDDSSFWAAAAAALFGIGTALVLDEFALVLHLDDVYWSEEGRLSVDVVFIAIALCGLALVGFSPFGLAFPAEPDEDSVPPLEIVLVLLINLICSITCLFKGKLWAGIIGLYLGIFSLVGAMRLARPGSPWAHRRYPVDGRKFQKAVSREARFRQPLHRFKRRIQDAVAGSPTPKE